MTPHEIRKANILSVYRDSAILKSEHQHHKYLRKEGEKYIYNEPSNFHHLYDFEENSKKDLVNIKNDITSHQQNRNKMTPILQQLTEQTQDLKEQFITQTENWAERNYNILAERLNWKDADWCKYLDITPEVKKDYKGQEYVSFPKNFYNTSKAKTLDNAKKEARYITGFGLEEYIKREIKGAKDHYESSLLKLVDRLNKKGIIDGSDFTITKARIGVNLEITIKHDGKLTKAWTIVAEGDVQRPHYRYLIK